MKIAPSSDGYITASKVNGKARFVLEPIWYVYFDNPADSVLVSGEFNEP